jgi:hypothetical protein
MAGCITVKLVVTSARELRNGNMIKRNDVSTPYSEAARRTFSDAELLYNSDRLGTPDHLYGLACECALKAVLCGHGVISGTKPSRPFKKHIDELWGEYEVALQGRSMSPLGPNLFANWRAEGRYDDDKAFSTDLVAAHRQGAIVGMATLEWAVT